MLTTTAGAKYPPPVALIALCACLAFAYCSLANCKFKKTQFQGISQGSLGMSAQTR